MLKTSTERALFAQQVHAESHVILALRQAHDRAMHMAKVDDVLKDLQQDIAYRAGRLGRSPDSICDDLESARLEEIAAAARMAASA